MPSDVAARLGHTVRASARGINQEQRGAADISEELPESGSVDEDVPKAEGVHQNAKIIAAMTEGTSRMAGSTRALSVKPSNIASSKRRPIPTSTAWMTRQPPRASGAAPTVGAIIGTIIVAMAT